VEVQVPVDVLLTSHKVHIEEVSEEVVAEEELELVPEK
jgi:hypothetical protein